MLQFDPKFDILPAAQRELWHDLAAVSALNFVLYGGTAIALHLGHRESLDFDFFSSEPLDKPRLRTELGFVTGASILQDSPDTLVILATKPSGLVKVSLFGNLRFGRVGDPVLTRDGVLRVASLEDLMATKLKATLDRAEAKDYRDIAEMISNGVSLASGLSAFQKMFAGEPSQVLRAIGYFDDGDLRTLGISDRTVLRAARDQVGELPDVQIKPGLLSSLAAATSAGQG